MAIYQQQEEDGKPRNVLVMDQAGLASFLDTINREVADAEEGTVKPWQQEAARRWTEKYRPNKEGTS